MSWLYKSWKWLAGIVFLVAAAVLGRGKKWQDIAVDNEEDDIQNDLHQAEKANKQAAKHDKKAHAIKKKAKKKKSKKSTQDILNGWRK